MEQFLNILTWFSLALIVLVLVNVRRAHIRPEYSVSWLLAGTVLLVLAQWPALDRKFAEALGTGDVPTALLMVAGAVFLLVLYRLSLRISGLKDSNIKLAQKVAILEYRLESLTRTETSQQ